MSAVPVILLGAYGTGTNWTAITLTRSGVDLYRQADLDPDTRKPIRHFFKHYVVEHDTLSILEPPSDALYLCLVKSPLFWISSLKRMTDADLMPARQMKELKHADMSTFIRSPGQMVGARRELEGEAFVDYDHLPDLWNRYATGYLEHLPRERTLILPYESAVNDPPAAFGAILDRLGAPRSELEVHAKRRMNTGHDLPEAQSYYGDDRNRTMPFSDDDITFVTERIDRGHLEALGYRPDGSIRRR